MAGGSRSSRSFSARLATGTGLVLVGLLVIMVNYLGHRYHLRLDWTRGALYSLSTKSQKVLEALDRDVEVVILMSPAQPLYGAVRELVSRYDDASTHISVQVLDPQRNPAQARVLVDRYDVETLDSVVFDAGEDRRVIRDSDLADYDTTGFGESPAIKSFKGEQLFTAAILELMEERKPKILFTAGHGEAALEDHSPAGLSTAATMLVNDNFALEEWVSLGEAAVPDGTDLVVVAAPRARLLEQEMDALHRYVNGGGRLLIYAEPQLSPTGLETTGLEGWLAEYGVVLGSDIVVDPSERLPLFGLESFTAGLYLAHPVTQPLERAGLRILLTSTRSVSRGQEVEATVRELVTTTADGWGETDLERLELELDERDLSGPVALAAAVVVPAPPGTTDAGAPGRQLPGETAASASDGSASTGGRMVIFGDVDLIRNSGLPQLGNPSLFINAVNWLAERENLLGIPAKEADEVRLNLSPSQLAWMAWISVVVLPMASLMAAVVVYYRRRR